MYVVEKISCNRYVIIPINITMYITSFSFRFKKFVVAAIEARFK